MIYIIINEFFQKNIGLNYNIKINIIFKKYIYNLRKNNIYNAIFSKLRKF